jgi:hypothetical protein
MLIRHSLTFGNCSFSAYNISSNVFLTFSDKPENGDALKAMVKAASNSD